MDRATSRRLLFPGLLPAAQSNKDPPSPSQLWHLTQQFQRLTLRSKPADHNPKTKATPFRLLDLPVELRKLIYDYTIDHRGVFYNRTCALSHQHAETHTRTRERPPDSAPATAPSILHPQRPCIVASGRFEQRPGPNEAVTQLTPADAATRRLKYGLVLANRQVSAEFSEHVYESTTFNFIMAHEGVDGFEPWRALSRLSATTLRRARRCKFWFVEESLYAQYLGARYLNRNRGRRDMWIDVPSVVAALPELRRLSAGLLCPVFTNRRGFRTSGMGLGPRLIWLRTMGSMGRGMWGCGW